MFGQHYSYLLLAKCKQAIPDPMLSPFTLAPFTSLYGEHSRPKQTPQLETDVPAGTHLCIWLETAALPSLPWASSGQQQR